MQENKSPLNIIASVAMLLGSFVMIISPHSVPSLVIVLIGVYFLLTGVSNIIGIVKHFQLKHPQTAQQELEQVVSNMFSSFVYPNTIYYSNLIEIWNNKTFLEDNKNFSKLYILNNWKSYRTFKQKYVFIHLDGYLCIVPISTNLESSESIFMNAKNLYCKSFSEILKSLS